MGINYQRYRLFPEGILIGCLPLDDERNIQ